jgi:FKBP-type peptidyl-prolyl cis-trans isomerase
MNGKKFDSSLDRNKPFSFKLGRGNVILGWDEGVQKMCKGEVCRIYIKPEYGYGSRGVGSIPPDSMLVFDIELVDFQ